MATLNFMQKVHFSPFFFFKWYVTIILVVRNSILRHNFIFFYFSIPDLFEERERELLNSSIEGESHRWHLFWPLK
jgi:hypothetical protein